MQRILAKQENIELILKGYNDCKTNLLKNTSSEKGEDVIKLIKGSIRYRQDLKCYEARVTINYKVKSIYSTDKNTCIKKANLFYRQNYKQIVLAYDEKMISVNDWIDTWYDTYKNNSVKNSTKKTMLSALNKYIRPYFAKYKLKQVTALIVDNFLNTIPNSRHKETISTIVGDIFRVAFQKDIIKKPIHTQITKYKHERSEGHCLTAEEQESFLKNYKKVRDAESLMFAYLTGARKHGVMNLTTEDIDFKNKQIHLRETKTKTSDRFIPISKELEDFLKSLDLSKKYLFRLSDWKEKKMIDSISEICGFRVMFKDMRTTYATKLRESGIAPEIVKKWLGHSSYGITEKYYVKISQAFENKEIEKLNLLNFTTQNTTQNK